MATTEEVVKLSFELTEKVPGAGKKIATSLNTLANSIKKLTELKIPVEIDQALVSIAASSKAAAAGAAELKKAVTGLATPLNNSAKALVVMKESLAGNTIGLNLKKIGEAASTAKTGITELNQKQVTSKNKTAGAKKIVTALESIGIAALAAKTMILSLNTTPITGGAAAGGAGIKGAAAGISQLQALMSGALLGGLANVKKGTEGVTNAMAEMGSETANVAVQSTATMSKWDHYRGVVQRTTDEFAKLATEEKSGIQSSTAYDAQITARKKNLTDLNNIIRDAGNELSAYEQKYPDEKKRTADVKQQIRQRQILKDLAQDMVSIESPKLEGIRDQSAIYDSQKTAVESATNAYKKLGYAQSDLAISHERLKVSGKSDADRLRTSNKLLDTYDKKITTVRNTLSDLATAWGKDKGSANSKAITDQMLAYKELNDQFVAGRKEVENTAKGFKGLSDSEKNLAALSTEVNRLKDGMVKTTVATKDFSEAVKKGVTSKSIDSTVKSLQTHIGQIDRLGEKYGTLATKDQGLITLRKGLTDLVATGKLASANVIDSKKPITDVKKIIPEVRNLEGVLTKLQSKSAKIGKDFAGGLGGEVKQNIYGDALREMESSLAHLNKSANTNLTQVRKAQDRLVTKTGVDATKIKSDLKKVAAGYSKLADESKRSLATVRTQQKDFGLHGEALAQLGIPAATLRGITEEGAVMSRGVAKSFAYIGKAAGRSSGQMRTVSLALNDLEKQFVRFRSGVVTWSTGLLMLGAAVSAPFFIAIKATAKLSDSLGVVKGITNATAVEFENLKETAEVMGRTTRFTAIEAAKGLEFLGRAGFDAATAAAALPVALKLAQAAAIDLGKAADIVTNMMTAFGLSMEEIPHAADVMTAAVTNSNATLQELGTGFTYIGSLASSMGADLEDLVAALAKLHNAGFKGCHSDDTEILTKERGFVLFKDLHPDDQVMTINQETLEMEWQHTDGEIYAYEIDEPLFHIETKSMDYAVTDNHRLFIETRAGVRKIIEAKDFKEGRFFRTGIWKGTAPEYFELPGFTQDRGNYTKEIQSIQIDMKDWMELLGWYFSEGSINEANGDGHGNYKIVVSQSDKNPENQNELRTLFDRLPFNYNFHNPGNFAIANQQLHRELFQYGKGFAKKRLPEYLKNLSPELLKIFYEAFRKGDGDDQGNLYVSNEGLAEDLFEIVIKCDWAAQKKQVMEKGDKKFIGDREITATENGYLINVSTQHTKPFVSIAQEENKKKLGQNVENSISWKPYKGMVYSVKVPNTLVYVRRNGKGVFSGNTMAGTALRGTLAALVNPTKDEAELLKELGERIGGLGLIIKNAEGDFVGFGEIIRQLEDASFTADEALRLFGKRAGPGVAALLKIGSAEIKRFTQSLEDSDGITSDIASTMEVTLAGSFKKLFSAMEGLALSVGNNLTPALQFATEVITDFINKFVEFREAIGPFAVLMDLFVASIAALTAVLGAATFAWFLMLVPAVQFISFAHVFITAMSSVAVHLRKGTIATEAFVKSTKVMNVALLSNQAILKKGVVLSAAGSAAQMREMRILAARSKLTKKMIADNAAVLASSKLSIGKTAAALRADEMLQDMRGLKSKIGEIFKGMFIFGRELAISFGKEVSNAFVAAGGGAAAFAAKTGIASKALLLLKASFVTFITIISAHPIIAGLTAIGITMLLLSKNSKVLSKELQDNIDKLAFVASESKRHISAINSTYKTLNETPIKLLDEDQITEGMNTIQDHLRDLFIEIQKVEGIRLETKLDTETRDFIEYKAIIIETGEEIEVLGDKTDETRTKQEKWKKSMQGLKRLGVAIEIQTDEEAFEDFSKKVQITVKELERFEAQMQFLQKDIDELRKIRDTFKANGTEVGVQNKILESYIGRLGKLKKQYNLTAKESQEFGKILAENLNADDQKAALEKLAKQAQENAGLFTNLILKEDYIIEYKFEGLDKAFTEYKRLVTISKEAAQAANVQNLGGSFQSLDSVMTKTLEHGQELLDDYKQKIEEVLELRGQRVDFELTGVEENLKVELDALKRAHEEKLNLYKLEAKDHYNLKLRETEAVVEFEQLKLISIKKADDKQRVILTAFNDYKKQLLAKTDTKGQLDADIELLAARKALLSEEVSAHEKAISTMLSGRRNLQKKLISLEETRVKYSEKIQTRIKKLAQSTWSDRRKLKYEEKKLDELIGKAQTAAMNGQVDLARKLLNKIDSQAGLVEGFIGDKDGSARARLIKHLKEAERLSNLVTIDSKNQVKAKIDLFNEGIGKLESSLEKLTSKLEEMTNVLLEMFKQFAISQKWEVSETGIKQTGQEATTAEQQVAKFNEAMADINKEPVEPVKLEVITEGSLVDLEKAFKLKLPTLKIPVETDEIKVTALLSLVTELKSELQTLSGTEAFKDSDFSSLNAILSKIELAQKHGFQFENIDDLTTLILDAYDAAKQAVEKNKLQIVDKTSIEDITKLLKTGVVVDVEVEIKEGILQTALDPDPVKILVDDSELQAALTTLYKIKPKLQELEGEELKPFIGIDVTELEDSLNKVSDAAAGKQVEDLAEAVQFVNSSISIMKTNADSMAPAIDKVTASTEALGSGLAETVGARDAVDNSVIAIKALGDSLQKPVLDFAEAITVMIQAGGNLNDVVDNIGDVRLSVMEKSPVEGLDEAVVQLNRFKESFQKLDTLLKTADSLGIPLEDLGVTPEMLQKLKEGAKFLQKSWVTELQQAKKDEKAEPGSIIDFKTMVSDALKKVQPIVDEFPKLIEDSISGLKAKFLINVDLNEADMKSVYARLNQLDKDNIKNLGEFDVDLTHMLSGLDRALKMHSEITGEIYDQNAAMDKGNIIASQRPESVRLPEVIPLDESVLKSNARVIEQLSEGIYEFQAAIDAGKVKNDLKVIGEVFQNLDREVTDALESSKATLEDLLTVVDEILSLREAKIEVKIVGIEEQLNAELDALENTHQEKLNLYELDAQEHSNMGLRAAKEMVLYEQLKLQAIKASHKKQLAELEKLKKASDKLLPDKDKASIDKRLELDKQYLQGRKDLLSEELNAQKSALDIMLQQRFNLKQKLVAIEQERINANEKLNDKLRDITQRTWSDRRKKLYEERRLRETINQATLAALSGQYEKAKELAAKAEGQVDIVSALIPEDDRGGNFRLKQFIKNLQNVQDLMALDSASKGRSQINTLDAGIVAMEKSVGSLTEEIKKFTEAIIKAFSEAEQEKEFEIKIPELTDAEKAAHQLEELIKLQDEFLAGARSENQLALISDQDVKDVTALFREVENIEDLELELLHPHDITRLQRAAENFQNLKTYMISIGKEDLYKNWNLAKFSSALAALQIPNLDPGNRAAALKVISDMLTQLDTNQKNLTAATALANKEGELQGRIAVKTRKDMLAASTAVETLEQKQKEIQSISKMSEALNTMTNASKELKTAQQELANLGPIDSTNMVEAAGLLEDVESKVESLDQAVTEAQATGVESEFIKIDIAHLEDAKTKIKDFADTSVKVVTDANERYEQGDGFFDLVVQNLSTNVDSAKGILNGLETKVNETVNSLETEIKIKIDVLTPDLESIQAALDNLRNQANLGALNINVNPVISELNRVLLMWKAIIALKNEAQGSLSGGVILPSYQTGGIIPGYQTGGVISNIKEKITEFKEKVVHLATGGSPFKRPSYSQVPGSGSGDRVPAMLEPGEFIIKKQTVQALGIPFLNMLNKGALQLFNAGGQVASMPGSITSALSHIQMPTPVLNFQQGGAVPAVAGSRESVDIWLRVGDDNQKYLVQSPKDQAKQLVTSLKHLSRGLKGGR